MANDLLTPPESDRHSTDRSTGHELDALLGRAFEQKSTFQTLYENLHELLFPPKLPPLELTSKPIPVPDRMKTKMSPVAMAISTVVNGTIVAILLFFVGKTIIEKTNPKLLNMTNIDVGQFQVQTPKTGAQMGGGGGGGSHDIVDPIKGHLPKIEKNPITPPQVPVLDKPKLAIESAIDIQKNIQLPDNPNLPMVGVKSSTNVSLASNGQGSNGGMGTGSHGGLGSGNGGGYGPGTGGNTGGGLYKIGNGVSKPSLIYGPEAEFSDEARRAKYQGVVAVWIIIDAQGNVQSPRVVRSLGMGLDEKALEAVRKYKFRPAMKDGKPVPVGMTVEIDFHLL